MQDYSNIIKNAYSNEDFNEAFSNEHKVLYALAFLRLKCEDYFHYSDIEKICADVFDSKITNINAILNKFKKGSERRPPYVERGGTGLFRFNRQNIEKFKKFIVLPYKYLTFDDITLLSDYIPTSYRARTKEYKLDCLMDALSKNDLLALHYFVIGNAYLKVYKEDFGGINAYLHNHHKKVNYGSGIFTVNSDQS